MRFSPALRELDSMVVNIELTLTSIIQGVALTFLIENTRSLLSIHQVAAWLYALTGLCIIFIFWSRSILHTLTLIRWPLEFGHNFLYIASTLCECLLFTCLANPLAWFEMSVLYGVVVWVLFAYDMRMTRPREADLPSEASLRLSRFVERDSKLNVRLLIPALVAFNMICALCVRQWPGAVPSARRTLLAGFRAIAGPSCLSLLCNAIRCAIGPADCHAPKRTARPRNQ